MKEGDPVVAGGLSVGRGVAAGFAFPVTPAISRSAPLAP